MCAILLPILRPIPSRPAPAPPPPPPPPPKPPDEGEGSELNESSPECILDAGAYVFEVILDGGPDVPPLLSPFPLSLLFLPKPDRLNLPEALRSAISASGERVFLGRAESGTEESSVGDRCSLFLLSDCYAITLRVDVSDDEEMDDDEVEMLRSW